MRVSGNRSSLLVLVAALAVPLGACTAITGFNSFHGGGGGADAGLDAATSSDDGGPGFDAGPRPDTGGAMCTPACLADEDCCSGSCVDLLSDPDHCGECGMVCPDRDNSSPACDELGCDFDCEPGFDDCDAEDSNGCEQRLNTADACGSCDNSCSGATPICNGATGTCVGSCTGTEMECDGTCVDVMGSDVTHCGSCTNVCAMLAGATRTCARGTCQYACEGGRLDCDGDLGAMGSNGCESSETTYYADMDGDGYGAGAAMMGCLPATAASMRAGDCDDRNRDINPGAVETCNGVSDDCDARTDEGITFMGTAVGGSCSCALGSAPGIVTCATAATATCTYPAEVCNGLDDDCVAGADDGFACVRGASSTCTGTGSIAGCTFVGMQSCDATCSLSACTAPAETCDMMDQNCDGFVDEGALTLGPPVGGYADMTAGARFVAAAWRGASEGGAALVMVENPTTGDRELRFYFVDPLGRALGRLLLPGEHRQCAHGVGRERPRRPRVGWRALGRVLHALRLRHRRGDPTRHPSRRSRVARCPCRPPRRWACRRCRRRAAPRATSVSCSGASTRCARACGAQVRGRERPSPASRVARTSTTRRSPRSAAAAS
jgi:hypothetical protein